MRLTVVVLMVAALIGGFTGCFGAGPGVEPDQTKLTLADYAPLIEAVVQAVDAYADEKIGIPDTPEGRLLIAGKAIAVQAALLPLKKLGFTESEIVAYLEVRRKADANTVKEAAEVAEASVAAVEKAADLPPAEPAPSPGQ